VIAGSKNCQCVSEVLDVLNTCPRQLNLPTGGHTNTVNEEMLFLCYDVTPLHFAGIMLEVESTPRS